MNLATEHLPSDSRDHRSGHLTDAPDSPGAGRTRTRTTEPTTTTGTRGGFVGGAVVNVVLLGLLDVWPGWDVVPFLTDRTALVLGIVNASLVVGIAVNLVLAAWHPPRLKALGDVAIGAVGTAALGRIWQVFPFDLQGTAWETVVRVLLAIGLVGSGSAMLVALVRLVRGARYER